MKVTVVVLVGLALTAEALNVEELEEFHEASKTEPRRLASKDEFRGAKHSAEIKFIFRYSAT